MCKDVGLWKSSMPLRTRRKWLCDKSLWGHGITYSGKTRGIGRFECYANNSVGHNFRVKTFTVGTPRKTLGESM